MSRGFARACCALVTLLRLLQGTKAQASGGFALKSALKRPARLLQDVSEPGVEFWPDGTAGYGDVLGSDDTPGTYGGITPPSEPDSTAGHEDEPTPVKPCNAYVCEGDVCSFEAADDGEQCWDNPNRCFIGVCEAGACTDTQESTCVLEGPDADCVAATCMDGHCAAVAANEGGSCDGQDRFCAPGICKSGMCTDPEDSRCTLAEGLNPECNRAMCDGEGNCAHRAVKNGVVCYSNSNSGCSQGACRAGDCANVEEEDCPGAGSPVRGPEAAPESGPSAGYGDEAGHVDDAGAYGGSDAPHLTLPCSELDCSGGACVSEAVNEGKLCDGNPDRCFCGMCSGGTCVDSSESVCGTDESNPCTAFTCTDGVCGDRAAANEGAACEGDGHFCGAGVCSSGVCVSPSDSHCTLPEGVNEECNWTICDDTGSCGYEAIEGGVCFTNSDSCVEGTCTSGSCINTEVSICTELPEGVNAECNMPECNGGVCGSLPARIGLECTIEGSTCAAFCTLQGDDGVCEEACD
jgi:hypothetical protein